ncbi:uncharacterized protein [Arachis hypogaea]|uniref:uncharacterized protein n=1 Tax=Arachis hypogaea TaxID=3818 RepID=UPI003B21A797
MNFIKKCWEEVGQEFTGAVLDFFQSSRLPRYSKITWVALAPKFIGAKEIKDLRPISIVGCVYKVISKWLKARKKSAAIIKLDFQKAYDRVKWSFVDIILQKMGFGHIWRGWIKECVCSASMSVLINGSPTKPFKMERGLRQGDPLSPFLFVLVVDVLHRMIRETMRNGCIYPLLVGRDNIELSHLQFANDTILFCPMENIRNGRNGIPLVKWEKWDTTSKMGSGDGSKKAACTYKGGDPWKDICQLQISEPHVREKMIRGFYMDVGNDRIVRFWEDIWLPHGVLKELFPRLFSVSNLKGSIIGDCGFWDGLEWIWNFQWRKERFQWELALVNQLHQVLQEVVLPEEITSYSFTSAIWKGFIPPRIELFSWCGVLGYSLLEGNGPCLVHSNNTLKAGRMLQQEEKLISVGYWKRKKWNAEGVIDKLRMFIELSVRVSRLQREIAENEKLISLDDDGGGGGGDNGDGSNTKENEKIQIDEG